MDRLSAPSHTLTAADLLWRSVSWGRPAAAEVILGNLWVSEAPDPPNPSQPSGDGRHSFAREVVYYPGPRILVTDRRVTTASATYPVRELSAIECIHGYRNVARRVAYVCGALELAMAFPIAAAYGAVSLLCVGILTAIGAAAAIVIDDLRNPRWMAIRATYRDSSIVFFTSDNRQEFESVRRAVIRAVEANRAPRT